MTRAQQAAATRLRILERSVELFLAKGFAGSSTRELAAVSGVTERTLFNVFGNKFEVLRQGVIQTVVGAVDQPLLARSDFISALRASDGSGLLAGFVGAVTDVHVRAAALAEVVRAAAAIDSAAMDFWNWGMRQEVLDCHSVAGQLHRIGSLRPGLSPADVGDTLSVLAGHDTFWRLTVDRSWSTSAYRTWLLDIASAQLLGRRSDTDA